MLEIVSILFKSRTTHRLYPSETEGRTYEHIPPRNQISSYRYIRLDSEIAYRASCLLGPVLGPQEIPDCPAPLSKNGYKRTLMKKEESIESQQRKSIEHKRTSINEPTRRTETNRLSVETKCERPNATWDSMKCNKPASCLLGPMLGPQEISGPDGKPLTLPGSVALMLQSERTEAPPTPGLEPQATQSGLRAAPRA